MLTSACARLKRVPNGNVTHNKEPRRTYGMFRVLSLFSGAGGFDLGLEETGRYETAVCADHYDDALATLRKNAGHPLSHGGRALEQAALCDVDLSEDPLERIRSGAGQDHDYDFVVGGPPCQSFSVIGKRRGLTDPRGNLVLSYLSVVEEVRPGDSYSRTFPASRQSTMERRTNASWQSSKSFRAMDFGQASCALPTSVQRPFAKGSS